MKAFTIGLATTIGLAAAACGGSKAPSSDQPTAAQQTPQTPAQTAQQIAQGLQAINQNPTQPATAIDFEKLVALMPEAPAGWTRSQPKGQQISMGVAISKAEAEYDKGDASIHLEITDTSFNPVVMAPLTLMLNAGYSERSSDGYKKAAALGGSPGFETWENESKTAEVTVVISNRIIVAGRGHNVDNVDPVRALVAAVDQAKLKELK